MRRTKKMGLLPIILSALSIFSIFMVVVLIVSYVSYKMKTPKSKPYMNMQPVLANEPVILRNSYPEVPREEPRYYKSEQSRQIEFNSTPVARETVHNVNRFQVLNPANSFRYNSY